MRMPHTLSLSLSHNMKLIRLPRAPSAAAAAVVVISSTKQCALSVFPFYLAVAFETPNQEGCDWRTLTGRLSRAFHRRRKEKKTPKTKTPRSERNKKKKPNKTKTTIKRHRKKC